MKSQILTGRDIGIALTKSINLSSSLSSPFRVAQGSGLCSATLFTSSSIIDSQPLSSILPPPPNTRLSAYISPSRPLLVVLPALRIQLLCFFQSCPISTLPTKISSPKRRVLITGCSDGGIGAALAVAFHEAGVHVYATARNPSKMEQLATLGIETFTLDVQSEYSIAACVS